MARQVSSRSSARTLAGCSRGATTAETLIVLIPLLTIFLTAVQFSHAATADLVVKHSTVAAARAAIVISNPDANPGDNGPESDIINAAGVAMGPWLTSGALGNIQVSWTDASSRGDPFGQVTVTVAADYRCRVPIGRFIICNGASRHMTFTVALPHQGAKYRI